MSYNVILFGRNGNSTIRAVLDSLLSQTVMPAKIMAIDDGSTDGMYETLLQYQQKHPELITVKETSSKGKDDFSRLPLLWNMGLLKGYDFHMIAPSDLSFAPDYAERVLADFESDPRLAVCSGDWQPSYAKEPHGGGRFVRSSFFEQYYPNGYPHILGYETAILYRAKAADHNIKVSRYAKMYHHDRLGHSHNFKEFGYSMKTLGYYPPYALARVVMDCFNPAVGGRGALSILRHYLFFKPQEHGYYSRFPKEVRHFVSQRQKQTIKEMLL